MYIIKLPTEGELSLEFELSFFTLRIFWNVATLSLLT